MSVHVDVQLACDNASLPEPDFIRSWVTRAVATAGGEGDAEVSVRVVDADEIRALNRDYRQQDKPTNVLSFPAGRIEGLPADEPAILGDVVVCASVVREEAAAQDKVEVNHWAHLIVHGTLHLLGFDHETDHEAAAMEALETRILAAQGIPDPYGAAGHSC